jgi:hypothetical protein
MTDSASLYEPLAGTSEKKETAASIIVDTTSGSLPHRLFGLINCVSPDSHLVLSKIYVCTVAATILPLIAAATVSRVPLVIPTAVHTLPFLKDFNIWFMFLISFPCLVILVITDQAMLDHALQAVRNDGTIIIDSSKLRQLRRRWKRHFRFSNYGGQILGVITGVLVVYVNYLAYVPSDIGYWVSERGVVLTAGYAFFYCIFLFYFFVAVYVVRNVAIAFFLRDVVEHAQLHLLPLHPDGAGGLKPVGRLGLRNQYALTLAAINIVLLVIVCRTYLLAVPILLNGLILAAVVAYLVLGPLVFVAPLLPFRSGMLKIRMDLRSEIASRIRLELDRLRSQLPSGPILKEDEELIDRLRKVGAMMKELPVWPFDASTLRTFLTAYVIPVVPILASSVFPALKAALRFMQLLPS